MTDTPAHTALPWWALSPGTGGIEILSSCDHAFHVAWIEGEWDEQSANAAFIVRACNSHYLLVSALRASIDAIEDDRGLDDYICCSGYMCGCQGSSKRQLMLHDLRAALSQAGGDK